MKLNLVEPLMPDSADLEAKATKVLAAANRIGRALHPDTIAAVVDLLQTVNCYYSNLIEGHDTHPIDIERAMRGEYSKGTQERHLQEEARAHIEVQREMEERLHRESDLNPYSKEFLKWIHKEFYVRTPEEFRIVRNPDTGQTESVIPGELRHYEVKVGRHIPPVYSELSGYLDRLSEAYDPLKHSPTKAMVALAAANHRILWVHPFGDGNGRVTRLMTDACLRRIDVSGYGLWNVSRGLARRKREYLAALEEADSPRWDNYDGRGALSLKALESFCHFFLDICIDQLEYMSGLLHVDSLLARVMAYGKARQAGALPGASGKAGKTSAFREEMTTLLEHLVLRGKVERSEVRKITGLEIRTARRVVSALTEEGFVTSKTSRAPLYLRIPAHAAPFLFPRLFNPPG